MDPCKDRTNCSRGNSCPPHRPLFAAKKRYKKRVKAPTKFVYTSKNFFLPRGLPYSLCSSRATSLSPHSKKIISPTFTKSTLRKSLPLNHSKLHHQHSLKLTPSHSNSTFQTKTPIPTSNIQPRLPSHQSNTRPYNYTVKAWSPPKPVSKHTSKNTKKGEPTTHTKKIFSPHPPQCHCIWTTCRPSSF